MTTSLRLGVLALALVLATAMGCKHRSASPETKMSPQFVVAVAPFSVPRGPADLLAGYIPDRTVEPLPDALTDMDALLAQALHVGPDRNIISASRTKPCKDSTRREGDNTRLSTIKYWQAVGKCANAQFILVPMAVNYSERQGSAAGSTKPAWVVLDLYLVNVKTGGLVNHFHYDYQQQALSDNILEIDKFLKRKGQWVTAAELAKEGIIKGVKELGL